MQQLSYCALHMSISPSWQGQQPLGLAPAAQLAARHALLAAASAAHYAAVNNPQVIDSSNAAMSGPLLRAVADPQHDSEAGAVHRR